jgi:hypothetical protein
VTPVSSSGAGGGGGGSGGGVPGPVLTGVASGITTGTASALEITVPSGTKAGDLMIVCVLTGNAGENVTPTGWTQQAEAINRYYVYTKTAVAGDIGSTIAFSTSSTFCSGLFRSYTTKGGLDGAVAVANGSSGTVTAPAVTSTNFADVCVLFAAWQTSGNIVPTCSGGRYFQAVNEVNTNAGACEQPALPGSTVAPGMSMTGGGTVDYSATVMIAP